MESSIAKFLWRQPACERLPTTLVHRSCGRWSASLLACSSLVFWSAGLLLFWSAAPSDENSAYDTGSYRRRCAKTFTITAFTS